MMVVGTAMWLRCWYCKILGSYFENIEIKKFLIFIFLEIMLMTFEKVKIETISSDMFFASSFCVLIFKVENKK